MAELMFLGLELTDECYNGCSFCSHSKTSGYSYFPAEKIYGKIKHFDSFSLGGGEPLFHPSIEDIIKNIKESADSMKYVSIMTSGINPDAPAEKISRFYGNMIKASELASENLYVQFIFSYSDGKNPRLRLKQFCKNYNRLKNNHLIFNIVTKDKIKKKSNELKRAAKRLNLDYLIGKSIRPIDFAVAKNYELLKEVHCAYKDNNFFADIKGNLQLCSKPYLNNLYYANLITDSFEEILSKRKEFVVSLNKCFEEKGNNCFSCLKEFKA
jgi:organic radical activating enzyme